MNKIISKEIDDYRREREVLMDELSQDKDSFANQIKDELGEEIKRELIKKDDKVVADKPQKKRINIFKRLMEICR